jgi:hypothetical protein
MIIRQTFIRGNEEDCLDEFMTAVPSDPVMMESLSEVFSVIRDNVIYKEFFVIQVDTDAMTAGVVDVV